MKKLILLVSFLLIHNIVYAAGGWIKDSDTGCKIWNPGPVPNESISWSGQCVDGVANGVGTLVWFENGKINGQYTGEITGGKYSGKGISYYSDKTIGYNGEWLDYNKHGNGTLHYRNGGTYNGSWKNDKKHGAGRLETRFGNMIEGTFFEGRIIAQSKSKQRVTPQKGSYLLNSKMMEGLSAEMIGGRADLSGNTATTNGGELNIGPLTVRPLTDAEKRKYARFLQQGVVVKHSSLSQVKPNDIIVKINNINFSNIKELGELMETTIDGNIPASISIKRINLQGVVSAEDIEALALLKSSNNSSHISAKLQLDFHEKIDNLHNCGYIYINSNDRIFYLRLDESLLFLIFTTDQNGNTKVSSNLIKGVKKFSDLYHLGGGEMMVASEWSAFRLNIFTDTTDEPDDIWRYSLKHLFEKKSWNASPWAKDNKIYYLYHTNNGVYVVDEAGGMYMTDEGYGRYDWIKELPSHGFEQFRSYGDFARKGQGGNTYVAITSFMDHLLDENLKAYILRQGGRHYLSVSPYRQTLRSSTSPDLKIELNQNVIPYPVNFASNYSFHFLDVDNNNKLDLVHLTSKRMTIYETNIVGSNPTYRINR